MWLSAIHADAHALERDVARLRIRIEADELRIGEQVSGTVVLRRLEEDVRLRHTGDVLDTEQQEVLLADPCFEVLLDLGSRERAVVDRDEPQHARPRTVVAHLVTQNECEAVVPVGQRAAACAIHVAGELAVHVDATAVDGVERNDYVLKCCLQTLGVIIGRKLRCAIRTRGRAAAEELVVVEILAEGEIASVRAARVADDAGIFLSGVARNGPRFDRILTRGRDQLLELAAGGRRGLSLCGGRLEDDTPTANPIEVRPSRAREREIRGRIDTARIEHGVARARLELIQSDRVLLVAIAARSHRAVVQGECLADHGTGRHFGRLNLARHRADQIFDFLSIRGAALTPAVVRFVAQADHEARALRIIQVDLRHCGDVSLFNRRGREVRLLRRGRSGAMTVEALAFAREQIVQRLERGRRILRQMPARLHILIGRCLQLDLFATCGRRPDPCRDPARQNGCA